MYKMSGIYLILCCEMKLDMFLYGQSADIESLIYKICTIILSEENKKKWENARLTLSYIFSSKI